MTVTPPYLHALPPGICLKQTYYIQSVLGEGGFGITYKGIMKDTGTVVAIKEYFPPSLAVRSRQEGVFTLYPYPEKNAENFRRGQTRFLNEAAILRSFQKLDCIVSVYDLFEENGTAYLVMEYIEGLTLRQYINENGTLTFPEISELILPVIRSLAEIHDKGLIHRDISPDNLILGTDNNLHLIDFGAASHETYTASTAQNTVILKAGYAPPEQYMSNSKIGAWIDVYSLCATIYFSLTGGAPAEAIHRLDDSSPNPLPGLSHLLSWQRAILEKGLQLRPADRFQNMYALSSALKGIPEKDGDSTVLHTSLTKENEKRFSGRTKKARLKNMGFRTTPPTSVRTYIPAFVGVLIIIAIASALFIIAANRTPSAPDASPQNSGALSSYTGVTPSAALPASEKENLPDQTQTAYSTAQTQTPPVLLTMPDLTEKSLKNARKKLKSLDSSIRIETTYSYSKKTAAGKVISQSVAKGVTFSRNQLSSISLEISKGKKPSPTAAPSARAAFSSKPTKKPANGSDYHVRENDGLSSIPLD